MRPQTLQAIQPEIFVPEEPARPLPSEPVSSSVLSAVLLFGAVIALVGAALWTHSLGSSVCHIRPTLLAFGGTSEISATAPAGAPCTIIVQPGNAFVENLTIESPPKFGTLTPRGRTGVIYRPYKGSGVPDEFEFAIHGGAGGPTQKSVIRVLTNTK